MNQQFFDKLTARLTELTADLRFYHKPTRTTRAPQIIGVQLEEPVGEVKEADEYPFVRWVVYQGSFAWRSRAPFSVRIDAGIYTNGAIADGNNDIMTLTMALGRLVETPWFAPYKLTREIPYTVGVPDDPNKGAQAHPYYHSQLYPEFIAATGHGG